MIPRDRCGYPESLTPHPHVEQCHRGERAAVLRGAEAVLAGVLEAHQFKRTVIRSGPSVECWCGEYVDDHNAHVAAEQAAALAKAGESDA